MDWSAPGRVDAFAFEKIVLNKLNTSKGNFKNITGGRLTFDFSSDLKISGSLNIIDREPINNCYIRVWYKPTLNGVTESIKLCTCYASTANMTYKNGMWSGTVNLRSVLARFIDDEIIYNWVFEKGTKSTDNFKSSFSAIGVTSYTIKTGTQNVKRTEKVAYTAGTSPMNVLKGIAEFADAEITCDTHGRTIIQDKVKNEDRKLAYELLSGSYSVTLPGLEFEDSTSGTTNRVVVRYKYTNSNNKEVTLKSVQNVDKSNAVSFNKQGRRISKNFTVDSLSSNTQGALDKVAKKYLATESAIKKYWKLDCFYQGNLHEVCLNGQLIRFTYNGLTVKGLLESVDMDLSPGGMLSLTVLEVGRSGKVDDNL